MIFRYNESANILTLDPAFAKDQSTIWPCRQLYNGLIELDTNLQVQPCIAKRWNISPDGLTYTFTLRDDIYFHKNELFDRPDSTRRVVASDFVYSFNRITDPTVVSPGAWIFQNVAGLETPNDTTFVIHHTTDSIFVTMNGEIVDGTIELVNEETVSTKRILPMVLIVSILDLKIFSVVVV